MACCLAFLATAFKSAEAPSTDEEKSVKAKKRTKKVVRRVNFMIKSVDGGRRPIFIRESERDQSKEKSVMRTNQNAYTRKLTN